jgi:DNA-binding CsgD family transcriptional regulator
MLGQFLNDAASSRRPTSRESEVIRLVAFGLTNVQIAIELGMSRKTVEFHLTNLYRRYQLPGRAALVLRAVTADWIKGEQ